MKKISIGKIVYIIAILVLVSSFSVFLLEKSQIINLYSKPLPQSDIYNVNPINKVDYSPADPTDNDAINQQKETGEISNNNATPPAPGAPINVVLTAATQDSIGGPVVVRVLLSDVTEGTCDIKIFNDTVSKQYTKNVVNAGTYYNCEALDIPYSDLSIGVWTLEVNVSNGDRTGSASQTVEVKG